MVNALDDYITAKKSSTSGVQQEIFTKLEELHSKKQWHQLTEELKSGLRNPEFVKGLNLKEFYQKFIQDFEHRINQLSLVEILLPILDSMKPEEAVTFLTAMSETVKKDDEAVILVNSTLASVKLSIKTNGKCPHVADIRVLLEETEKKVEGLGRVTRVHGHFHKANADYLCETADHAGYYREALRYLGCIDVEQELSHEQRLLMSQRLCLSALLGKDVYNFGELLAHTILSVLTGRPEYWLVELLKAFNAGDIAAFRKLEAKWAMAADIKAKQKFLEEKIQLLSVMEAAFARPSQNRKISFKEISEKSQVPMNKVEHLVMKTLSRGLVKGSIDQVDQSVTFTWVQPRVLDKKQMGEMRARIEEWSRDVKGTADFIENNASEILVKDG